MRDRFGNGVRTGLQSILAVLLLAVLVLPVAAQEKAPGDDPAADAEPRTYPNPRLSLPRSSLHDPFDDHVLVAGYAAVGGGIHSAWESGRIGYGGALVFRPGAANSFLDFLYDWNAGAVLQIDHQNLGGNDEVLSGDGIVRRYFRNRGDDNTEVRIFAGVGVGATRFSVPGTGGLASDKYFSAVGEVGQEWLVDRRGYFFVKAQFRYHLQQGRNYRVWSVQAGAGLPWPF
ncbi:MAG: hypothetical protein GY838_06240 [bacterium]|nr:hypothetical protein [bacterium]